MMMADIPSIRKFMVSEHGIMLEILAAFRFNVEYHYLKRAKDYLKNYKTKEKAHMLFE